MVIVIGTFTVEPEMRNEFIAHRVALMQHSRQENGCITYSFSADPIDSDVVVLTERWSDRAALDAHLAGLKSAPQPEKLPAFTAHFCRVLFETR
jgi:quinol monooxygenase YgiN